MDISENDIDMCKKIGKNGLEIIKKVAEFKKAQLIY